MRCLPHARNRLVRPTNGHIRPFVGLFQRHFEALGHRFMRPGCCALCHEPTGSMQDLCQICVTGLPLCGVSCHLCALPMSPSTATELRQCGRCSVTPPPVRVVLSVCLYHYPADIMVHRLKYSAELKWGRIMGLLMVSRVQAFYRQTGREPAAELDMLVPIPLSHQRYGQRGYNQSLEIAQAVSRQLVIPLAKSSLHRIKHGRPQAGLSAADRRQNVKKVFSASSVNGQRIALIDDVLTTGTTVFDAASELLSAGAASVDVWVFARTP